MRSVPANLHQNGSPLFKKRSYRIDRDQSKLLKVVKSGWEKNFVSITHGKFSKVQEVFKQMQEWKTARLSLCFNFQSDMIKEIVHIDFPVLTELALSKNWIQSVESLQFLKAPALKILYLNFNNIMTVSSLRKWVHSHNLQKVIICKQVTISASNPISDPEMLQECDWPYLQQLSICDKEGFDVLMMVKISSNCLKLIKAKKFIPAETLHEKLQGRWPALHQ